MRNADFSDADKRNLALRVGVRCSNPACRALTSGPQVDPSKALNIGVAAHISAASAGGARYDASLSEERRRNIANGIWLCQGCAKLIDNDPSQFSVDVLSEWKTLGETEALRQMGKSMGELPSNGFLSLSDHLELEINSRFGFSFLYPKTWDRRDPHNNDGNVYVHPTDARTEIRAWGCYAVVSPTLEDWVGWTLRQETHRLGYRVITDRESGRYVHYFQGNGAKVSREQIRGRRVLYEVAEDGIALTIMQIFAQFSNSQFAIRCQTPSSIFFRYELLFLTVGQSLRVIGEHPR